MMPATRMRVASITKLTTYAVTMELVKQRRLRLRTAPSTCCRP